jgi:hypothetical protein
MNKLKDSRGTLRATRKHRVVFSLVAVIHYALEIRAAIAKERTAPAMLSIPIFPSLTPLFPNF